MRDLQGLLKRVEHELLGKVQRDFGSDQERYKEKVEKVKDIKSTKDLKRLNDSERIRQKIAQLEGDPIALERMIGRNNLMDIHYFHKALEVAKTVCRIVFWPNRTSEKNPLGTGFLVGPGLLMTNNHVIPEDEVGLSLYAEFDFERRNTGGKDNTPVFKLDPDSFFMTGEDLDYTIIAVEPEAVDHPEIKPEHFGWNVLTPMRKKIIAGQFLTIIQHPRGVHKMIAFRENQLVEVHGNFVHYTTDTDRGSSGSLVANDDWEIIALHRSAVPLKDENEKIILTKGGVWQDKSDDPYIHWIANQGVLVDSILADVFNKEPNGGKKELKDHLLAYYQPENPSRGYQLPD